MTGAKHQKRRGRRAQPTRTCVGCRRTADALCLVRLTRDPAGAVVVDHPPRLGGRGVWVCPSSTCVTQAVRRNAITRSLHGIVTVPEPETVVAQMTERVASRVDGLLAASGRARHVAVGASETKAALHRGRAQLVVLAADVSPRVRAELEALAKAASVPVLGFGDRLRLGQSMARSVVGALALLDAGLSEAVRRELVLLSGLGAERLQMNTKPSPESGDEALERAT